MTPPLSYIRECDKVGLLPNPSFMDHPYIKTNELNLKREVIGNKRLQVMQKFLEPHILEGDHLRNKSMDISSTKPDKIDLSLNSFRDRELDCLHTFLPKELVELNLAGNKLGPRAIQSLVTYLESNKMVKTLNIECNALADSSVADVVDCLACNSSITCLRLGNNYLDEKLAKSMRNFLLSNATLCYLGLSWSKLR